MTKFRISDEVANKIDLCSGCGELWLDGGEWEALEVLDLAGAIPKILSDPWQKAIRIKETSMKYEARQKDMLGDADHSRLSEFCIWMQSHAKRREIIDYINRKNAET